MTAANSARVIILRMSCFANTLPATGDSIIPSMDMMVLNVLNAVRLIPRSSVTGAVNSPRQLSSRLKNVAMMSVQARTIHQP